MIGAIRRGGALRRAGVEADGRGVAERRAPPGAGGGMAYDLLIRNATIVDGTGGPRKNGAVAVQDGVIQAVGEVSGEASRVVDAHGQVVAPGFIDPHTHMDFFLRKYPAGLPVVNYG